MSLSHHINQIQIIAEFVPTYYKITIALVENNLKNLISWEHMEVKLFQFGLCIFVNEETLVGANKHLDG